MNPKVQIGTFFYATAIHVRLDLDVDNIDYDLLRSNLNRFYYLSKISIYTSTRVTIGAATRILSNVPGFCYHRGIIAIDVDEDTFRCFEVGMNRCGRKDLVLNNRNDEQQRRSRKRTPSPIRDMLRSVKRLREEYFDKYEETSVIPKALTNEEIVDKNNYIQNKLGDVPLEEMAKKEDIDGVINDILAPEFLESVLLFDRNWVFVTQFEVYYRNNDVIDPSAMWNSKDRYYDSPVATVKPKNERGRSWYEVSIFWKRFELLVTAGLTGAKNDSSIVSFIGPNVPLVQLIGMSSNSTDRIHVVDSSKGVAAYFQERSLRDWTKASSSFKWACVSERFRRKGFTNAHPLYYEGINNMAKLISAILRCICRKTFTNDDHKTCLEMLKNFPAVKDISPKKKTSVQSIRTEIVKIKNKTIDIFVLDCLAKLEAKVNQDPSEVLTPGEVTALSSKVSPYCRTMNQKALNFYRL
ncbi:hypothetical protein EC973_002511 [Apophysomyces ossiformis]|uniref:Uncharacterized protein n=1 Tax=Apophysomyces ossiformis TaxID=679940 RepID=A0A8H7BY62_9FUNG|nr:hypothetical protein EC973_002511 [Apophysomyces ossiformis]